MYPTCRYQIFMFQLIHLMFHKSFTETEPQLCTISRTYSPFLSSPSIESPILQLQLKSALLQFGPSTAPEARDLLECAFANQHNFQMQYYLQLTDTGSPVTSLNVVCLEFAECSPELPVRPTSLTWGLSLLVFFPTVLPATEPMTLSRAYLKSTTTRLQITKCSSGEKSSASEAQWTRMTS
jgi:hypothetical protein